MTVGVQTCGQDCLISPCRRGAFPMIGYELTSGVGRLRANLQRLWPL